MEPPHQPDYTDYYVRLQSFNHPHQWAGEPNVYIKDLVEAGFVYTGQSDLVFCFRCGLTVSNWKEEDNAVARHREKSKDCAYIMKRSQEISLSSENPTPPPQNHRRKLLSDFVKESLIYDWLPGKGVVARNHDNDNSIISNEDCNTSNCATVNSSGVIR